MLFDFYYCKSERPKSFTKTTLNERITHQKIDQSFAHTGIDYIGPLLVKLKGATKSYFMYYSRVVIILFSTGL